MMENKNKDSFEYTYSAKEQEEIKRIREKYAPKEENKMELLHRLDSEVSKKARTVAIIIGVIGALIMGIGMSLVMSEFGNILGKYKDLAMPIGICIGVVGGIIASLAYPIYNLVMKSQRKKVAPEILRLTDELMK